jgi:hypothetical protein
VKTVLCLCKANKHLICYGAFRQAPARSRRTANGRMYRDHHCPNPRFNRQQDPQSAAQQAHLNPKPPAATRQCCNSTLLLRACPMLAHQQGTCCTPHTCMLPTVSLLQHLEHSLSLSLVSLASDTQPGGCLLTSNKAHLHQDTEQTCTRMQSAEHSPFQHMPIRILHFNTWQGPSDALPGVECEQQLAKHREACPPTCLQQNPRVRGAQTKANSCFSSSWRLILYKHRAASAPLNDLSPSKLMLVKQPMQDTELHANRHTPHACMQSTAGNCKHKSKNKKKSSAATANPFSGMGQCTQPRQQLDAQPR